MTGKQWIRRQGIPEICWTHGVSRVGEGREGGPGVGRRVWEERANRKGRGGTVGWEGRSGRGVSRDVPDLGKFSSQTPTSGSTSPGTFP